ncbi:MAG: hypothetical protein GY710_21825 [Desulfobacteraceae bacterium]|nr:hypothetical protein [Desulfobacteraceae bacterium]
MDYESNIRHEAKNLGIDLDKDYEIKAAKRGSKLFVVFAKTKSSEKLIKIFDSRMTQLAESGEIEKIYLKWGLSAEKFGKERFDKD